MGKSNKTNPQAEAAEVVAKDAQLDAEAEAARQAAEAEAAEKAAAEEEKKEQGVENTQAQSEPDPWESYKKVRVAIENADLAEGKGDPKYAVTDAELKAMLKMDGTNGRPLMRDRKKLHTLYIWAYGEKFPFFIPFSGNETIVEENGQVMWPCAYFRHNGVSFMIHKQKPVSVPKFIMDLFNDSYDITRFRVPQIELDNGYKSRPVSPGQGTQPVSIAY